MVNLVDTPTRLTVVTPGKYIVGANILWADSATGRRITRVSTNGSASGIASIEQAIIATATQQSVAGYDSAVAGDYYETIVFQSSGGPLSVLASTVSPSPHFWAVYQGA